MGDRERGWVELEPAMPDPPDRRRFLALGVGLFAVAALPPLLRSRRRLHRRTVPVMGTLAGIAVVEEDPVRARAAIDAAVEALRAVERRMSRFRPDSDVGRLNAAAGRRAVPVHPSTARVLEHALRWARATEGAFDPCLERVVRLWEPEPGRRPPPAGRLEGLAGAGLHRSLELDRKGGRHLAALTDPRAGVDLGGVAKGWAVDRAVEAVRERGIGDVLVTAGGDLQALGRSAEGDPWRVGIRDPEAPDRLAGRLAVRDRAVATSGDYERFFLYAGRRYHHLLDPATAAPRRTSFRSLTVSARRCVDADAGATAAFGRPRGEAAAIVAAADRTAKVVSVL